MLLLIDKSSIIGRDEAFLVLSDSRHEFEAHRACGTAHRTHDPESENSKSLPFSRANRIVMDALSAAASPDGHCTYMGTSISTKVARVAFFVPCHLISIELLIMTIS